VLVYKTMRTTIQLDDKVRDQLKEMGKKGETYEQIIVRLLEERKNDRD
jgi:predicted CopG family antitoxin